MFSKFKKVLVSLALASSLALAPMNVSAANDPVLKGIDGANNNSSNVFTVVNYSSSKFAVEVPESILFSASNLEIDMPIKLKFNSTGKTVAVKPTFNADEDYSSSITKGVTFTGYNTMSSSSVTEKDVVGFLSSTEENAIVTLKAQLDKTDAGKLDTLEKSFSEKGSTIGRIVYAISIVDPTGA